MKKNYSEEKDEVRAYENPYIYGQRPLKEEVLMDFIDIFNEIGKDWVKFDYEFEKERFQKLISNAKNEYEAFKDKHEHILYDVQTCIDEINKKKPIIKDYVLKSLSIRLNKMGIKSTVSDYPMEHLDYRNFFIKEEYDITNNKQAKLEEDSCWDEVFWIIVPWKTRKIKKKLERINVEVEFLSTKMDSDLGKLNCLYEALKHIAGIYSEITEKYTSILNMQLEIIDKKYSNDYDSIPSNTLKNINIIAKTLQSISEKKIIDQNNHSRDESIEGIIKFRSDLESQYNQLRDSFSKLDNEE